jgi:hypothetical protein
MTRLEMLQAAQSLNGLAILLGFKPKALAYLLYKQPVTLKYSTFTVAKRSGGTRTINTPNAALKELQARVSDLLQDCISDINKNRGIDSAVAHGFRRKCSIITNAGCHRKKRFVFNLDLEDFFGTINFGRVRGFFINNNNFQLNDKVATVLAQICCHNNSLPQGAPSSPVVSNLLGHILDMRLVRLAEAYGCDYSRYADDLTFSTNERSFPTAIARKSKGTGDWSPGKKLTSEITRAGYSINASKTRMQYTQSRQDVTGLVVNAKVNVAADYVKNVRAMAHSLFSTGAYWRTEFSQDAAGDLVENLVLGTIEQLRGMLSFIENVKGSWWSETKPRPASLMSYEKTHRDFLFYEKCFGNQLPTIFFEGRTDNIYIRAALERLYANYPELVEKKGTRFEFKLSFVNYTDTTARKLGLAGGSGDFNNFITKYEEFWSKYKATPSPNPVILFIDNDEGAKGVYGCLRSKYKHVVTTNEPFIHVTKNLYVIATPKKPNGEETMIEDFFPSNVLSMTLNGKKFNPGKSFNSKSEFGKVLFAEKVVRPNRASINFSAFGPILDRIRDCISDYATKA